MAHYSLWFPNKKGNPAEILASVGMAELAEAGDLSPSVSTAVGSAPGPGGTPGSLIQWLDATRPPNEQSRMGYNPGEQEWSPLPAIKVNGQIQPKGTVWIGFEKDRPVTPTDLLRTCQYVGQPRYVGESVTLGDGNDWQFPNQFDLPMEFAINPETGEDMKAVVKSDQPIWERMNDALAVSCGYALREQLNVWNRMPEEIRGPQPEAASELQWNDFEVHDYCLWALSLNYRLTKLVGVALRLFNNTNLWQALYATTDRARIAGVQLALKKTQGDWEQWHNTKSQSPDISGGAKV